MTPRRFTDAQEDEIYERFQLGIRNRSKALQAEFEISESTLRDLMFRVKQRKILALKENTSTEDAPAL